jgi:hypothetical protein
MDPLLRFCNPCIDDKGRYKLTVTPVCLEAYVAAVCKCATRMLTHSSRQT